MKVLLLCGGKSTENLISRMSATNIRKLFKGYDVVTTGIDLDGTWYQLNVDDYSKESWLEGSKRVDNIINFLKSFDVVFPALHGLGGEDGSIQGLFETADIPYIGMGIFASSVTLNKVFTKKYLESYNIPMTPYLIIKKINDKYYIINDELELDEKIVSSVKEKLGFPVFVKASNGGSSIGCYKVLNEDELLDKVKEAAKYDNKVLIEKYINARELECAVLGNDNPIVSKVGEILPHGEFYSYDSKYNDEISKVQIPANIDSQVEEKIRNIALKSYLALDGKGLSRIDFFLDKETNEIYLNEINSMPGFTDISMYPLLINYSGINGEELINRLIDLAIKRYQNEKERTNKNN